MNQKHVDWIPMTKPPVPQVCKYRIQMYKLFNVHDLHGDSRPMVSILLTFFQSIVS